MAEGAGSGGISRLRMRVGREWYVMEGGRRVQSNLDVWCRTVGITRTGEMGVDSNGRGG